LGPYISLISLFPNTIGSILVYVQHAVSQHFLFLYSDDISVCELVLIAFLGNIFVVISRVDQSGGSFWPPVLKFLQVTRTILSMEVAGCECL